MCEYCGCRQVEPIAELMDEHLALLDLAGDLRRALVEGDLVRAETWRAELVDVLAAHTGREEAGVFAALRAHGDFVEEVDALEDEHVSLDHVVGSLDLESPGAVGVLDCLVADLTAHIDRENLGIFPVAVVTLGVTGWGIVERAHRRSTGAAVSRP